MSSRAEDILAVLFGNSNQDLALEQDVDVNALKFTVIVDAPDDRARRDEYRPFERGEIIINYGHGSREPFGEGRKPDKWDVHPVSFDTLTEAKQCRRLVLEGKWPRTYQRGLTLEELRADYERWGTKTPEEILQILLQQEQAKE